MSTSWVHENMLDVTYHKIIHQTNEQQASKLILT